MTKVVGRSLYGNITVYHDSYASYTKISMTSCYLHTNPEDKDAMIYLRNVHAKASYINAGKDLILRNCSGAESSFYAHGTTDEDSGAFGKHMLVTGRGNLLASNGEISGYKVLKAISTAYGMSSIRYRLIDATFKIDGNVITLLPGSRATAHPDDPLYRYFSADGPAGPGGSLNLYCSGLVNVQALNTLLGGIQGLAGAASGNPQDLLEGLIGGFVGGMGEQDFRDSRAEIAG